MSANRALTVGGAVAASVLAAAVLGCNVRGLARTPSATPAPTQAPTAVDSGILYEDSFTDPASGWSTVTTGISKSGYHPPDAYHLEVSSPANVFWIFREQDFSDFSAETQTYVDSTGGAGEWRHGLAFRQAGDGQFYAFVINPPAQKWQVVKRAPDGWHTLAEGLDASIQSAPKAINTLRVDAQGANMTFSVNGVGVATLADADYASGDFGFVVETFDQSKAHIHFDSLGVRKFDAAAVPAAPTAGPVLTPTPSATGTPTATPTATPTPTRPRGATQPGNITITVNLTDAVATLRALGTLVPPITVIPAVPTIPPLPTVPAPR